MTLTDDMVAFVVTATPPEAALTLAVDRLDAMGAALRRDGEAVAAAHPGGSPTAMNRAWRIALDALRVEGAGWPVIAATVLALQQDSPTELKAADAMAVGTAVAEWTADALSGGNGGRTLECTRDRGALSVRAWPPRGCWVWTRPGCATSWDCVPPRPRGYAQQRDPKPAWCRRPRPPRTPWRPRPLRATDSPPRPTVWAVAGDCSRCWRPAQRLRSDFVWTRT